MASLREVKDRIASVRSTLKITSAMKLVASSKLRKAQRTIEALRPYEETLSQILAAVSSGSASGFAAQNLPPEDYGLRPIPPTVEAAGPSHSRGSFFPLSSPGGHLPEGALRGRRRSPEGGSASASPAADGSENGEFAPELGKNGRNWSENGDFSPNSTIVLAFASNSSMCGAFNANVIKKTLEVVRCCNGPVDCWAFGRKMAEALRKEGIPAARDYTSLVAHPSFDAVAAVAAELRELYAAGEISGAVLVYNHFVSTGRQEVVVEPYLSSGCSSAPPESFPDSASLQPENDELYILEPSRAELLESLMPQVLDMKLYAALLDSAASEHAARMIAMQTATDNAEELLGELTLEYNKGRQQKITSEILDLVSGEAS